ncbi:MAG: MgtC/SapB family protein [Candidatus Nitrosotenuis sp.]
MKERTMASRQKSTRSHLCLQGLVSTSLSLQVDPNSTIRIAAYVVGRIELLGGDMIIKGDIKNIFNLITTASIWFVTLIEMAIKFGYYAIVGTMCAFSANPICGKTKKEKSPINIKKHRC